MSVPLRVPRLVTYALTWCFAVISSAFGLNALIKSRQDEHKLKSLVSPPTVLDINVNDAFTTGVVATVVCLLIAILTFFYITLLLLPSFSRWSTRTLTLQLATLAFLSLWLFAVQVPYTLFFATRSARVRAFVGSIQLPDDLIKRIEAQLGTTSVYRHISYLKWPAIFPWITLALTLLSVALAAMAMGRVRRAGPRAGEVHGSNTSMVEKEGKEGDVRRESAAA